MSLQKPFGNSSSPSNRDNVHEPVLINGIQYRQYLDLRYSWSTPGGNRYKDRANYVSHPWMDRLNIYCYTHKRLEEHLQGLKLQVELASYYTCGPCGQYADIRGEVGGINFHGRTVLTGSARMRDLIKPIQLPGFIVSIDYGFWHLDVSVVRELN